MGAICQIKVHAVTLDDVLQPRAGVDQEHWRDMSAWLRDNPKEDLPAIDVVAEDEFFWCWNGFHRTLAYRDVGRKQIVADVRKGTKRDAMLLSFGANAYHGLKRTTDDKNKVVVVMLADAEWRGWADREIARHCNVSADLVGRLRREAGQLDPGNGRRAVKFVRAGKTVEMRLPAAKAETTVEPVPEPVAHLPETTDETADKSIGKSKVNFRTLVRQLPDDLYKKLMPPLDTIKEALFK